MTRPIRTGQKVPVFAGMRGHLRGAPGTILTIDPIFPGSCQAKRFGYRWVCTDPDGCTVFAPFRDFILEPLVGNDESVVESSPESQ